MIYSELEQELDDFLARPNVPDEPVDGHWRIAVEQLEGELAEESGLIDKNTMIRIIAKSVVAYDKQSLAHEETLKRAMSAIGEMERASCDKINSFRDWVKKASDEWIAQAVKDTTKNAAKNAAIARHATTYEKRDQVIGYWRKNISVDKSNEFAAEWLQKQFPEISHRTLARYVAEAKKLPPAGTL